MSEIKFACPSCQQHIQCDSGYGGMEIPCPACNSRMIVPQPAGAPPLPPPAAVCPGCGAGLAPQAILCTQCGYNLRTGQRVQLQSAAGRPATGRPGAARPAKAATRPATAPPWYRTIFPYMGLIGVVFVGLYLFARQSPDGAILFLLAQAVYSLTVHIIVVVHAFKEEGAGPGMLCLCIPFYAIYYVFFKSESQTLQILYGFSILLQVASFTVKPSE